VSIDENLLAVGVAVRSPIEQPKPIPSSEMSIRARREPLRVEIAAVHDERPVNRTDTGVPEIRSGLCRIAVRGR
jgi:hypothetical protein